MFSFSQSREYTRGSFLVSLSCDFGNDMMPRLKIIVGLFRIAIGKWNGCHERNSSIQLYPLLRIAWHESKKLKTEAMTYRETRLRLAFNQTPVYSILDVNRIDRLDSIRTLSSQSCRNVFFFWVKKKKCGRKLEMKLVLERNFSRLEVASCA